MNPRKPNSQDITGAFLPVTVCGKLLSTSQGDCSAEQALCIAVSGDQQLQLARQLTAAELNCNIATCPNSVLNLLTTCNNACIANNDQNAIGQCIEDVDAFNNGIGLAPGCHDRIIPGFQPPGPAGSTSQCNADRADSITIFTACP